MLDTLPLRLKPLHNKNKTAIIIDVNCIGLHFHCNSYFFDTIPTYEQEERSLRHSVVAVVEAVVIVLESDSR